MPGFGKENDKAIIKAIENKTLSMEELDSSAQRIAELILKGQNINASCAMDIKAHHELAEVISSQCAVLLKNQDSLLPLPAKSKLAIIGEMSKSPRYQGSGSSKINPRFLDIPYDSLEAAGFSLTYSPGYTLGKDEKDTSKIEEAVLAAKKAPVAVIFAGLPEEYESEGFDRKNLSMPESHNALISAVARANPNTIVVLQCGSPILMPWAKDVKSILMMYLAGEGGGKATADLLSGKVNPSGKLAETFPLSLKDVPSNSNFPGTPKAVQYCESIYVGYRYYETACTEVAFPFGYGLSYTSFEYSDLKVENQGDNLFQVEASIKNTGNVSGAEVAQLYVSKEATSILRSNLELKGFDKIYLKPGESKKVHFTLDYRSFAYYNTVAKDWCIEGGNYKILLGPNSRQLPLNETIFLKGDGRESLLSNIILQLKDYAVPKTPFIPETKQFEILLGRNLTPIKENSSCPFTIESTLGDMKNTFIGKVMIKQMQSSMEKLLQNNSDKNMGTILDAMLVSTPVRTLRMFSQGKLTNRKIQGIVDMANNHFIKGFIKFIKS